MSEPSKELVETGARALARDDGRVVYDDSAWCYPDLATAANLVLAAAHDAGLIVYRDEFIEAKLPGTVDGEYTEQVVWIPTDAERR